MTWANILATLLASLITGVVAIYSTRQSSIVQHRATSNQAAGGESERAWKRAEHSDHDADKWREKWAEELEKRLEAETEARLLKARLPTPLPTP